MHSAPDLPGLLPTNLNLAPDTVASIYSRPRLETAHRTSLMSTGSSGYGTGSTSDQDQPEEAFQLACSSVLSGIIAAAIVTSTCLVAIAGKRWLGTARH